MIAEIVATALGSLWGIRRATRKLREQAEKEAIEKEQLTPAEQKAAERWFSRE